MIRAVAYAALALPVVLIVIGWRAVLKQRPGRAAGIVLGLVTASYLWILAVAAFAPVVAPDYSDRRFITIYVNMAVMLGCVIVALLRRQMRRQLLLASCVLLLLWVFAAGVSSAV
jgi:hypothetical protein